MPIELPLGIPLDSVGRQHYLLAIADTLAGCRGADFPIGDNLDDAHCK